MKKYTGWIFLFLLAGIMFTGFHNQLSLTEYHISNARIPQGFDGYRIAVVSDLHTKRFGDGQQELISMLRRSECDLICLTGDIVSQDTTDFSAVWELIDGMPDTPMIFVAGNNELLLTDYARFLSELTCHGVTVLDDVTQPTLTLYRGADSILIHGYSFKDDRRLTNRLPIAESGFYNILLYHDPYPFHEAALLDYDLMLSGHVHGGIIRFPLIGSPLELLRIEPFTKGIYTGRAATLVVSGGLGAHEPLPRFFNDPEVVLITLDAPDNEYREK